VIFGRNIAGSTTGLILLGAQSVSSASDYTPAKISGGSVTLTMWKMTNDVISGYTGNETFNDLLSVHIAANTNGDSQIIWVPTSITFTNGNATKTWSEGTTHSGGTDGGGGQL